MKAAVVSAPGGQPEYAGYAEPEASTGREIVALVAAGIHPIVRALVSGNHYGSAGIWPCVRPDRGERGCDRRRSGLVVAEPPPSHRGQWSGGFNRFGAPRRGTALDYRRLRAGIAATPTMTPHATSANPDHGAVSAERLAAREAALRYVDDRAPGIGRKKAGRSFSYYDAAGRTIRDPGELRRIKTLAIPPAYADVWICPFPNGHLQATGRDARGRKQYRYHKRWREVRDEAKYRRAIAFAGALSSLRTRVAADLAAAGLNREKVLATVARLLDTTLVRVGNEAYARENDSYGLTTLRAKHVTGARRGLRLRFRGKSGVAHEIAVSDRRLVAVIRRCRDLPGQELFTYIDDDGNPAPIGSHDLNAYVGEAMGDEFTAKDFRTWHGTVLCAVELSATPCPGSTAERRRAVTEAIKRVATSLRNTPAVCRSCYVHPAVVDRFMSTGAVDLPRLSRKVPAMERGLDPDERRTLQFLRREARRDERATLRRTLRRSVATARRLRRP